MFQFLSDINHGIFTMGYFVLAVLVFAYFVHKSNKKNLEDFYRKYPKYDPRRHKNPHPSHN